jgi:hypothetical protein
MSITPAQKLVFLARELGRRLQRDPSMISRLVAAYASHRDPTTEARIRQAITSHHS